MAHPYLAPQVLSLGYDGGPVLFLDDETICHVSGERGRLGAREGGEIGL